MRDAHLSPDERYAAKLVFQMRFDDDVTGGFRTVEERIVLIHAPSGEAAYQAAQKRGRLGRSTYLNDAGHRVHIEYVGVVDLMHLGPEVEDDEVWYDIRRMKDPMARKADLIPRKSELSAIRLERERRIQIIHPR
ncbi:DUF4288 domain-containing protein [Luteibacter yeojuensis]|uniref:Uncharacterized protein n=1 Tax=Luteibacter yeojuensis TaxID=345309 RepID=A0A0F3L199_9GAMM|nr:DUF4288 domain-containing protein [Luteibacter yeojuensis]KJV37315.1 hypothetical protein VI08_00415 [Luteibacter yeojuensis]